MARAPQRNRGTLGRKQRDLAQEEEKIRRKVAELERVIRQKPGQTRGTSVGPGIILETKRDKPWSLHATVNPALRPRNLGDSSLRVERKKVLLQFISLLAVLLVLVLLLISQLV
jgi:hypothetical protein